MAKPQDKKDSRRCVKIGINESVAEKLQQTGFSVTFTVTDSDGNPRFSHDRKNLVDLVDAQGTKYLWAEDRDGRTGYSRVDGSHVFGGLHDFIYPGFEMINRICHIRAKDSAGENEREALFDEAGIMFSGRNYDTIQRKKTVIEEDVFEIEDGGERGFLLSDCSLFGKKMSKGEADIRKFAGEPCLHVTDNGKEQYVSRTGEALYGGWAVKLQEFKAGETIYGIAVDEEGKLQIYSHGGEKLYGEKPHDSFGQRRLVHDLSGILLEVYDKQSLAVLDRAGKNHYGQYHHDPKSQGFSMQTIDGELILRFLDEDMEARCVRYWRHDNTLAYGGKHEEELSIGDGDPLMLAIGQNAETAKKFGDNKKIEYFSRDGDNLFAGYHDKEIHAFPWKRDLFICFYDDKKGYCYFDMAGTEKFGGYHPKIRNVKMITFEKEEERQHAAFLEVLEPVPIFSLRRLGNFARFKFGLPITYYGLDGQRFNSLQEINDHLKISEMTRFEKLRRSDSVVMKAVKPEDVKEYEDKFSPPRQV